MLARSTITGEQEKAEPCLSRVSAPCWQVAAAEGGVQSGHACCFVRANSTSTCSVCAFNVHITACTGWHCCLRLFYSFSGSPRILQPSPVCHSPCFAPGPGVVGCACAVWQMRI